MSDDRETEAEEETTEKEMVTVKVKRRGRPLGSKNKNHRSLILPQSVIWESITGVRSDIFYVLSGNDIAYTLAEMTIPRQMVILVISVDGMISDITINVPPLSSDSVGISKTFEGTYKIVSMCATFLPPSAFVPTPTIMGGRGFSISFVGPDGVIMGGLITGPLLASGTLRVGVLMFPAAITMTHY
ncbi:hypothetical protein ZOSMA_450G00030 [Zostera marina]|uniref:PPC domain-containing protein n=1 Tax=Zostera marina TaxID=29655 RepID=A0A0K9P0L3_ZOSMR|nr:hypothetical protein ZOSMA_450G00030 [Zostera marina]